MAMLSICICDYRAKNWHGDVRYVYVYVITVQRTGMAMLGICICDYRAKNWHVNVKDM